MSRRISAARHRDTWRAAGLAPSPHAEVRRGVVCLHPDPDLPDPKRLDRFRAKGGTLIAMLIAENRAEQGLAEYERVQGLIERTNRPPAPGPAGEDHGHDLGPSAMARQAEVVRVGGKIRGAGQHKAEPVTAVKFVDPTMFDRMHRVSQLNDRQHAAGIRLHKLWVAAGLEPQTTPRYPVMTDPEKARLSGDEIDDLDLQDGETPLDQHRKAMRLLPAHMAALLDSACMWVPGMRSAHPGVQWLATFQAGLDVLADHWEIPREGL